MRVTAATATVGRALAGGVLLAGVLVVLYLVDPARCRLLPPCPIHWATGFYCPGCGSTRAIHCLLHGDLHGALSKNALMVLSIPLLGLLYLRPSWAYSRATPWIALAVLLGYAVLRNVNAYPFTLLAPH